MKPPADAEFITGPTGRKYMLFTVAAYLQAGGRPHRLDGSEYDADDMGRVFVLLLTAGRWLPLVRGATYEDMAQARAEVALYESTEYPDFYAKLVRAGVDVNHLPPPPDDTTTGAKAQE